MSSIHLQIFCSLAVLSILSGRVSSQYGSGKPPSPTYGAPGVPQGGSGGYGGAPPPAPSGGKPAGGGYGVGGGGGGQEGSEPEPFNFNYQVKDDTTGTDFGHKADSDGKTVNGVYNVALPDGRKQIVTYKADENGYQADVKYEGEAIPGPSGPAPGGSYGPPQAGGGGAKPPGGSYGPPQAGGGGAKPPGGSYGPPPAGGFKPPPAPAPSGGANGNFPSGYPSGGGGGPVKGSGGFGGYRRK